MGLQTSNPIIHLIQCELPPLQAGGRGVADCCWELAPFNGANL
jgi:hypothetical protein